MIHPISRDLKSRLKAISVKRNDTKIPAFIGDLRTGVVKVPGSEYLIYVTIAFNGQVMKVRNKKLPNTLQLAVMIGYEKDSHVLQVIGESEGIYSNISVPHVAEHNHTWGEGDNPAWIRREQILDLLPAPEISGMIVNVGNGVYSLNQVYGFFVGQTFDLTANIPAVGAKWVYASIDSLGVASVTEDVTLYNLRTELDISNVPQAPNGELLLFACKVYAGQTSIINNVNDTDLFDPRFIAGDGGSLPALDPDKVVVTDGSGDLLTVPELVYDPATNSILFGGLVLGHTLLENTLSQIGDGNSQGNFKFVFSDDVNDSVFDVAVRAGGTKSSPTAVLNNMVVKRIRGRGWYQSGEDFANASATQVEIRLVADGDWGVGDYPTRVEIWTTPDGSGTLTLAMTIGSDASLTLPKYGSGAITGTPTYNLAVDSAGKVIEVATGGGGSIPIVTIDPVAPADGELWLLRATAGAIADGVPIGLLLALTYTGNSGSTIPLQLSVWDDVTAQIIRY